MTPEDKALRAAHHECAATLHHLRGHIELTHPGIDQPTYAYATAEIRNATERLRMAITQLDQGQEAQ